MNEDTSKELRIAGILRDYIGVRNLSAVAVADSIGVPRETLLAILRGTNLRMLAPTVAQLILWLFNSPEPKEKTSRLIKGTSRYTIKPEEVAAAVEILEPTVRRKRSRNKRPDDVSDRLKQLVSTKYKDNHGTTQED